MAMDHWSAGFAREAGGSSLLHEGRGNGVGPLALREGRCDMAPMSRKMTDEEIQSFVDRFGGEPLAVPVAVEALALVVPAAYKIDVMSPDEVFHVFHLGPAEARILQNEAGEVRAYGVNSASERYRWFKNVALHGKKFSDRVIELADPLRLVERIKTEGGIGYARLAEMDGDLKSLKIDMGFGKIVTLTPDSARSGLYPYTRFFYIYLPPTEAGRPVDPRTQAFLDYVLSTEGQRILEPLGLYSLARKEQIYNANRLEKYRRAER